ncbi:anti-sigma factor family protein [Pseudomonadota bacterium]
MNCIDIHIHIDDWLDDQLSQQDRLVFDQHVSNCADCAARLENARSLMLGLQNIPVPPPSANFEKRVFAEVRRQHKESHHFRFAAGFATAATASLAIWFASSVMVPEAVIEQPRMISVAMNEAQTVRLMFESQNDIEQVQLSVGLPDNMELDGYPGRRQLAWQTSLKKGENILALPIMAIDQGQGELVAELSYGDKVKTFRVVLKTSVDGVMQYQLDEIRPT